ncbi:hypothetical protein DFP72DRAFT_1058947 [Ephemerocybe angulata]|nr:hypothetical protein DFP72DRAFT_1058947 [Tulosesus angulatus]
MNQGHCLLISSAVFFVLATYAILLGPFLPSSGIAILEALAHDTHYKYLVLLLVPTTSYFVIANWVGWQYYQNS